MFVTVCTAIDAAVLSVAQSYMAGSAPTGSNVGASAGKRWPKPAKPAVPNPNAEMKYCETCKVSCVGAQVSISSAFLSDFHANCYALQEFKLIANA